MRPLLAVLLILSAAPTLLAAQRAPLPISAGERVRLRLRVAPEVREGILVSIDTTTLTLRNAAADDREAPELRSALLDTIPFTVIRTIHVHRPGPSQKARSALGASILGAAGGGVIGFFASPLFFDRSLSSGVEPIISAMFGAVGGAALGFTWGMLNPNPWEAVYLPNTARDRR